MTQSQPKRGVRFLASAALVALAAPAAAQETPAEIAAADKLAAQLAAAPMETIVVTAERQPQPLQSVPAAVSAFTTLAIDTLGVTRPIETLRYVPNLLADPAPGRGAAPDYTLRGLGTGDDFAGGDPAVATYVDQVYLGRLATTDLGYFDVAQVEVLRGPQSTLYGRNPVGGVVSWTLAPPEHRLGGWYEVGWGSYDRWLARGGVDLPMSEGLTGQVSGFYTSDDGEVTNTTTGEQINHANSLGIRAALRLDLGPVRWDGTAAYVESKAPDILNFRCDPAAPTRCSGRYATTGLLADAPGGVWNPYAPATVTGPKAGNPLGDTVQTTLLTSNLQWVGEAVTLSLITGYVAVAERGAIDFADGRGFPTAADPVPPVRGYPSGGYTVTSDGDTTLFSQEVMLRGSLAGGALDYIVGAYFYSEDSSNDYADIFNAGGAGAGTPLVLADRVQTASAHSSAGYGQVDWHALSRLTLSAGVRYTAETRRIGLADNRPACIGQPAPSWCLTDANLAAQGVPLEQDWTDWAPRFVASWEQNENLMVYASASNGSQTGGWNSRGLTPDALTPFGANNVWSYEVGVRSQWFDNRLRANLTGFVLNVRDLATASAAVGPGGALSYTTSIADYHNRGIELELVAQPLARLSLFGTLGYQNDHYSADAGAPDVNAYGVRSVARQQRDCRAELALGKIPLGTGASNAASCAAGIVAANGDLAEPARTPQFTLTAGATYDFPIPAAGIVLSPGASVVYRSDMATSASNATLYTGSVTSRFDGTVYPANPFDGEVITGSASGAVALVNAQIGMRTDDGNWFVGLSCANCFDAGAVQSSVGTYGYLTQPRTWMIRAKRVF